MANMTVCDECGSRLGIETGMRLERIGDGFTIVRTLCQWETLDFCSWTCLAQRARREQGDAVPPPPPHYDPPLPDPVIHQREA